MQPEHAEDALHDLIEMKKWKGIVRNYDPARGRLEEGYPRFWIYLITCLKFLCSDIRRDICRHIGPPPLPDPMPHRDDEHE